jgi:hypothetical protein
LRGGRRGEQGGKEECKEEAHAQIIV